MPYRKRGTRVEKEEGGRWVLVKDHPTEEAARRHVTALAINVSLPEKHSGIAARLKRERKK